MAAVDLGKSGEVSLETVTQLMRDFDQQKLLNPSHITKILNEVEKIVRAEKNIVVIDVPKGETVMVLGNLAGQYYDLLNIFNDNGLPSDQNRTIALGNYVDRGFFSVEVMVSLFALKILYPNSLTLVRGNHEAQAINKVYGFYHELEAKYPSNKELFDQFNKVFMCLPLAALIKDDQKKVFAVHGGLCKEENLTLDQINSIDRFMDCPIEPGVFQDLLWSDPASAPGITTSPRGAGVCFGPDVTAKFLRSNGLDYMIRSHQLQTTGFNKEHGEKCVTVWSAPNYVGSMGNKGAILKLVGGDLSAQPIYYDAVEQPTPTWSMEDPVQHSHKPQQ